MKIEYSPKFFKRYSKLPKGVKILVEEKEKDLIRFHTIGDYDLYK